MDGRTHNLPVARLGKSDAVMGICAYINHQLAAWSAEIIGRRATAGRLGTGRTFQLRRARMACEKMQTPDARTDCQATGRPPSGLGLVLTRVQISRQRERGVRRRRCCRQQVLVPAPVSVVRDQGASERPQLPCHQGRDRLSAKTVTAHPRGS